MKASAELLAEIKLLMASRSKPIYRNDDAQAAIQWGLSALLWAMDNNNEYQSVSELLVPTPPVTIQRPTR